MMHSNDMTIQYTNTTPEIITNNMIIFLHYTSSIPIIQNVAERDTRLLSVQ